MKRQQDNDNDVLQGQDQIRITAGQQWPTLSYCYQPQSSLQYVYPHFPSHKEHLYLVGQQSNVQPSRSFRIPNLFLGSEMKDNNAPQNQVIKLSQLLFLDEFQCLICWNHDSKHFLSFQSAINRVLSTCICKIITNLQDKYTSEAVAHLPRRLKRPVKTGGMKCLIWHHFCMVRRLIPASAQYQMTT